MHCQIILGYFSKFRLLVTIKLIEVRYDQKIYRKQKKYLNQVFKR